MTAATPTDIVNKALTRLNVLTPDNPVDAAILHQVTSTLFYLHSLLFAQSIVKFRLSEIPDEAVEPLATELAWHIREDFGISNTRLQSLQAMWQQARGDLHDLAEVADNNEPAEGTFF